MDEYEHSRQWGRHWAREVPTGRTDPLKVRTGHILRHELGQRQAHLMHIGDLH